MNDLLNRLRAAGEPTRLRLLAVLAQGELTVSELTQIMGQSQPRVSRHLKLLCDARLIDRYREATWVFYRLAEDAEGGRLARTLITLIPEGDPVVARDLERLEAVKQARAEAAASYFRASAAEWDRIRSLYVPESEVERVLLDALGSVEIHDFLDIGTGTGRMLEIFAEHVNRGVGIDLSHEMLAIARTNLARAGVRHCHVRHADMYNLPLASDSFDAITIHQVLHFADNPAAAIAEAARLLRPAGVMAIVDFAPHEIESLRVDHAHRRLGFSDDEVGGWCRAAGLGVGAVQHLKGDPLTVSLWRATRPGQSDAGRAAA